MKATICLVAVLFKLPLFGASIPIRLVSVTTQQAEVEYASTIPGACTLSLADNSGLGVTVWDLNGSKFPGADQDIGRPDTFVVLETRKVLLGHRVYQQGSDGKIYSMSLQGDAPHTLTVTCGSDSGTLQFPTKTIQQGTGYPELPQFCPTGMWNHCWPTIDFSVAGKETGYVDAFTGALVKRVTGPGENSARIATNQSFTYAKDQSGGSWTNPNNALTSHYGTSTYAVSSTTSAKLLLSWGYANGQYAGFGNWGNGSANTIEDILVRLYALSSDGATPISVCITLDGQTCWSTTLTVTPGTSPTALTAPSGTWPANPWLAPFAAWSASPPQRALLVANQVTVNVSGTVVTLPSPNYPTGTSFNTEWAAGTPIYIAGSTCANNVCTLASVTDTTHLVINESQGTLTGATMQAMGGGVLVWKASGTGTISLNANWDNLNSVDESTCCNGNAQAFSSVPATLNFTAADVPLSMPHTGFLGSFGPAMYMFDTTTGSTRYLSSGMLAYNTIPDTASGAGNAPFPPAPFDLSDAATWYRFGGWGSWYQVVSQNGGESTTLWSGWARVTAYASGATILDPANHVQQVTSPGTSGSVPPTWNDSGSTTNDGPVAWQDRGLFGWASNTVYHNGWGIVDPSNHIQQVQSGTGTSGASAPTWNDSGSTTKDGTLQWVDRGVYRPITLQFLKSHYVGDFNNNPITWNARAEFGNISNDFLGCAPGTGFSACPAALYPNDLSAKWATLISGVSNYNATLWGNLSAYSFRGFHPSGYAIFTTGSGQDAIMWYYPYNISTQTFTGAINTFSFLPRWGSSHTLDTTGSHGYAQVSVSSLRGNCGSGSGCVSQGPYQIPITQVWRSTDGANGSGSNGGWDTNTCIPDRANSSSCATGNGGTLQYAYQCPAGTSAYWTLTQAATNAILTSQGGVSPTPFHDGNNCVQVQISGEPCVAAAQTTPVEVATLPCAWDATKSALQDLQVGDYIIDSTTQAGCRDCEPMQIVQISGAYPTKRLWLYRGASPTPPYVVPNGAGAGKFAHANGWSPRMFSGNDNVSWYVNLASPTRWYPENPFFSGSHQDDSAAMPGGNISVISGPGSSYINRMDVNYPGDFGTLNNLTTSGGQPGFNFTTALSGIWGNLETYPSGKAYQANDSFKRFVTDYRTPQNGVGIGSTDSPQGVYSGSTATLAGGFSNVYDVTLPSGMTLDVKNAPLYGNAGRYRLKDISGPIATCGSACTISDTTVNVMCWARATNDCFSGSTANHIYVNAKGIEPATNCYGNNMSISSICVVPAPSVWGQSVLKNVLDLDPDGNKYIRLTGMFNPPFNSNHFENLRLTPDGRWGIYSAMLANGYRHELFMVRIPNLAEDTVRRDTWVKVKVGLPGGDDVQIRFGYDQNFRCHGVSDASGNLIAGYNDACLTDGSGTQPFLFASETPVLAHCSTRCTINIPAISGRYLYYRIERYQSGALTYQSPTLRQAVQ